MAACISRPSRSGTKRGSNGPDESRVLLSQPADHRVVDASKSAQIPPHQHAGEPTGHRAGSCGFDEAGVFEELAGANVGHGEIDFLSPVIHGVTLDGWRTLCPGVADSTLEQGVREVFAA